MMKAWNCPTTCSVSWADSTEGEEGEESEEICLWERSDQGGVEIKMGEKLSTGQRSELRAVVEKEFHEVMNNVPGRTELAVHRIETGTANPIKLPPYRLQYAYRDAVKAEIEDMLKYGVIEPSDSSWASPMVVVKKDGSLRLCVDYRRLNSVTKTDAYPMPRVDELVDRLGQAKFITTLDLSKGYWQVPLAKEDRLKTAFSTPYGFYQFIVMHALWFTGSSSNPDDG